MKANKIKPIIVPIKSDQKYLTDVARLTPIPNNTIVDKTITGFGATYSEIVAKRNSIIIMPNIAIIVNKDARHRNTDNTFAVWGNVKNNEIRLYIRERKFPKKFLITPEAFTRVIELLKDSGIDAKNSYFLLIDESHKTTKDVGYRFRMVEPFKQFFDFKNKAMISATPLLPSDPRFVEYKFKSYKIQPEFDYQKNLTIIHVNDILVALRRYFANNDNKTYCIFFNSINGIKDIVEKLKIKDKTKIFCSSESVDDLRIDGYSESYYELQAFNKYNFFTSSFYNGLDIITDVMPDVILLTDIQALQTALDPLTDIVQILGRFRDDELGKPTYRKAVHFYTTNWKLNALEPEKAKLKVEVHGAVYDAVRALVKSNPHFDTDEELNSIYKQALQRLFYNQFLTGDEIDYFKIDNYLNDERVKSYYKSSEGLISAYRHKDQRAFNLIFKNYVILSEKGQHLNLRSKSKRYSVQRVREITEAIYNLENDRGSEQYREAIKYFSEHANDILQAYNKLGYQAIIQLGFKIRAIRKAVIKADFESKINHYPLIDAVQLRFELNRFYALTELKPALQEIYNDFGLTGVRAVATHIGHFFEFIEYKKKADGVSIRGYILSQPKQKSHPDYERT